jgi:hypothetical protein
MSDAGHVILDIRSAELLERDTSWFDQYRIRWTVCDGAAVFAMSPRPVIVTKCAVDESLVRLARVGIENVRGYLISVWTIGLVV